MRSSTSSRFFVTGRCCRDPTIVRAPSGRRSRHPCASEYRAEIEERVPVVGVDASCPAARAPPRRRSDSRARPARRPGDSPAPTSDRCLHARERRVERRRCRCVAYASAARSAASSSVPGARPPACRAPHGRRHVFGGQSSFGHQEQQVGMIGRGFVRFDERGFRRLGILVGQRARHAHQRRHPRRIDLERLLVVGHRIAGLVALVRNRSPRSAWMSARASAAVSSRRRWRAGTRGCPRRPAPGGSSRPGRKRAHRRQRIQARDPSSRWPCRISSRPSSSAASPPEFTRASGSSFVRASSSLPSKISTSAEARSSRTPADAPPAAALPRPVHVRAPPGPAESAPTRLRRAAARRLSADSHGQGQRKRSAAEIRCSNAHVHRLPSLHAHRGARRLRTARASTKRAPNIRPARSTSR